MSRNIVWNEQPLSYRTFHPNITNSTNKATDWSADFQLDFCILRLLYWRELGASGGERGRQDLVVKIGLEKSNTITIILPLRVHFINRWYYCSQRKLSAGFLKLSLRGTVYHRNNKNWLVEESLWTFGFKLTFTNFAFPNIVDGRARFRHVALKSRDNWPARRTYTYQPLYRYGANLGCGSAFGPRYGSYLARWVALGWDGQIFDAETTFERTPAFLNKTYLRPTQKPSRQIISGL